MSLGIQALDWTEQPKHPVDVDWSNPLARGLEGLFSPATTKPINAANSTRPTNVVGSGFTTRPRLGIGNAWYPATASSAYTITTGILTDYPFTFFCLISAEAGNTTGPVISIYKSGTGFISLGSYSNFAGTEYPRYSGDFGNIDASSLQLRGTPRFLVGVSRSATDHELYVDGVSVGTSSSTADAVDSTFRVGLGISINQAFATSYLSASANVGICGFYSRALSVEEITELSKNPWRLYEPDLLSTFWSASGGLNCSFEDLAAAGVANDITAQLSLSGAADASAAPAQLDDMSIARLINLAADALAGQAQLDDVAATRSLSMTADDAISAATIADVALALAIALTIADIGAGAALPDFAITSGVVYNLLIESLGAQASLSDSAATRSLSLSGDSNAASADTSDMALIQLRDLIIEALDAASAEADVSIALAADLGIEALAGAAAASDAVMIRYRDLVIESLASQMSPADFSLVSKVLGLILNPALISVTPRRAARAVTPRRSIQSFH